MMLVARTMKGACEMDGEGASPPSAEGSRGSAPQLKKWKTTLLDLKGSRHGKAVQSFFEITVRPVCVSITAQLKEIEAAAGSANDWHELRMTQMISHQSFAMTLGALWERNFKEHLLDVVRSTFKKDEQAKLREQCCEDINSGSWKRFCEAFERVRQLPMTDLPIYDQLYVLHLVCSTVRHGEGRSSRKLYQIAPQLFMPEAELRDIWDYFLESVAKDSVTKLDIKLTDLEDFRDAVISFWEMVSKLGFGQAEHLGFVPDHE